MIYEIRDYHYLPEKLDAYKKWGEEAVPVLKEILDVVGFYVDSGADPEVSGSAPERPSIGYANITWIIRWESKAMREEKFAATMGSPAWQEIWAKHPCADGYLHMNARFMRASG